MPADPTHPDQLGGDQRLRADLVAYLDNLPVGELAELLASGRPITAISTFPVGSLGVLFAETTVLSGALRAIDSMTRPRSWRIFGLRRCDALAIDGRGLPSPARPTPRQVLG